MTLPVAPLTLGTPPSEYDPAYFVSLVRQLELLISRLNASGQVSGSKLVLVDGVFEPDEVLGKAQLFVDEADGDLKIKYADGFVATIAADS